MEIKSYLYEGVPKAERRIRVLLVGCGEQATNMIHNAIWYLDEAEVVGVCDINKDRADFAARRFGLDRSWQDLDEMLQKVDADAAFVVTIAKFQAGLALKCLKAGLHVYTEKPSGTEVDEIQAVIEEAGRRGLKAGVSFNKRYAVAYRDMKRAVDSPDFGKPSAFIAKFTGGYRTNETDLLRVGCCHFFDLARYLIGEFEEVYAYRYSQQPGRSMYAVNGRFVNGCVASMTFGSLDSWVNGFGMESVEVHGDRNIVFAENGRDFTWQRPAKLVESDTGLANKGTQAVTEEAVPVEILKPNYSNLGKLALKDFYINGNFQCVRAFVRSVLDGTPLMVDVHDGMEALRLALAVDRSLEEQRPVRLDEI